MIPSCTTSLSTGLNTWSQLPPLSTLQAASLCWPQGNFCTQHSSEEYQSAVPCYRPSLSCPLYWLCACTSHRVYCCVLSALLLSLRPGFPAYHLAPGPLGCQTLSQPKTMNSYTNMHLFQQPVQDTSPNGKDALSSLWSKLSSDSKGHAEFYRWRREEPRGLHTELLELQLMSMVLLLPSVFCRALIL